MAAEVELGHELGRPARNPTGRGTGAVRGRVDVIRTEILRAPSCDQARLHTAYSPNVDQLGYATGLAGDSPR